MSNSKKVWFITGSSTGLGRHLSEELLNQGYPVAATARKPEGLKLLKGKFGVSLITPALDRHKTRPGKKCP